MVKKVYFDCTWTGPEVSVDGKGSVTSQGSTPKGEKAPFRSHALSLLRFSWPNSAGRIIKVITLSNQC